MGKAKVRNVELSYDPEVDILDISIRQGRASDFAEVGRDLVITLDSQKRVLDIEIWRASKKLPKKLLRLFQI